MITFLDSLYEDEILYSWLARNHFMSGRSLKQSCLEYFGKAWFHQSVLYHTSLDYFIKHASHFDIHEINNNHTLTPILKPFVNLEEQDLLYHNNKARFIRRHEAINNDKVKICPLCYEEDLKENGEAYIHRIHQVPGSEICYKHHTLLNKLEYSHSSYFNINDFDYRLMEILYPAKEMEEQYVNLSNDILFVLSGGLEGNNQSSVREKYFQMLKEKGYYKGTVLNVKKFERDFVEFYSDDFLRKINLPVITNYNISWIGIFFEKVELSKSALRNLLIIRFLFSSAFKFAKYEANKFKPFGDGPWNCLNKNCAAYNRPVVQDCLVYYNCFKRCYAGKFKCSKCGYTYGQYENHEKPYLIDFGDVWREKLRSLILQGRGNPFSIAKELNCASETIKRQAKEMGLLDELTKKEDIKKVYRQQVEDYLFSNPFTTTSDLAKQLKTQYYYLRKNDKSYIIEIDEQLKRNNESNYWKERDSILSKLITNEINNIISEQKLIRITVKHLSKIPGCSTLTKYSKYVDKLPKTNSIINANCETATQYHNRLRCYLQEKNIELPKKQS